MSDAPLYPIFLDLQQRPVLVVGGGAVALRKVRALLESGAKVTVASSRLADNFADLQRIETILAPYDSSMMTRKPWRLVFAATHDPDVNASVYRDAARAHILCCRADELEQSDFFNGAVARLGPIILAVSTHGASPSLALRIRDAAQHAIDPALVTLAELSSPWRDTVKRTVPDMSARAALLQKLAGPEMEETLRSQGKNAAEALFARWLANPQPSPVDDA
jgi:uroporphyrin-III C-methyltransferase/precorrin-2 dehydrogenase/sirohydrochlorin ferrochelatase